jgi:uncharacterized protein
MIQTPPPLESANGNDKLWSIFCHLSALVGVGIVLPLIVYLVMRKESAYVAANARSAFNFHLSVLLYGIICIPLIFIGIGGFLLLIIAVGSFILAIIAAVKAYEGNIYNYPLTIPFFH